MRATGIVQMFFKPAAALLALACLAAQPVAAQQYPESYEFLKAVKERDGAVVMEMLARPGSTVANTRDVTTGRTAMHIVTERRDATWIGFLAAKGADPDVADKKGVTPLQIASQLGFVDGIEALIKAGARVDQSNAAGETPLIAAIHRRDMATLRLLLRNGADPDRNDNSGRSARDYAALATGGAQITQIIAEAEAERSAKSTGKTYGPSL